MNARRFLIVAATLLMVAFAIPAMADDIEAGFAVLLNVGTDTRPIEASLLLHDDLGRVLTPCQGVVEIEACQNLHGQIMINGAEDKKAFEVAWSTMALANEANRQPTTFVPELGWTFCAKSEQLSQPCDAARALKLWVRAFGAKKGFFRVIFKITPGFLTKSAYTTSQLFIKVVPKGTFAARNGSNVAADLAKLQEFTNATAAKVNNIDGRVVNVEGYLSTISSQSNQPVRQRMIIRCKRDCVLYVMSRQKTTPDSYPISAGTTTLSISVDGGDTLTYRIGDGPIKTRTEVEFTEEVQ